MDLGIETYFEAQFVGRKDELRDLQAAWNKKQRMFGIFGMRSVGTSRLAKEFLASVSGQYDELVYVNLKETSDLVAMYVNICAQLTVSVQSHPNDVKSWESMLFVLFPLDKLNTYSFLTMANTLLTMKPKLANLYTSCVLPF
ncbi:hypothetical protein DPMN_065744 [Dreissena polymorpha]|uniref:Uncharacterized protein n=1 Tax=Dreissena polymorpha TaxID=45954 RepID=A0A9D3YS69_DREPO|nr:hypothetical protein DPMN_065744 [Dreissena polymorpha]